MATARTSTVLSFSARLRDRRPAYAVDIRHWQNQSSGEVEGRLYRGGVQIATSRLPAVFPVEGGTIEVAMSGFGVTRCHYVTADGNEHQLHPDRASGEGRRARFNHRHPTASRLVAAISVTLVLTGVVLLLVHLAESLSRIPPIAESVGTFTSPVEFPLWLTIALAVGAAAGSAERALRLRYHWLLDAAGN